MSAERELHSILATTDVHSHLSNTAMLSHLHRAREQGALVVDCGDFFEGTGYYRLGRGRIERDVLTSLYDVIAPGNHGWLHHFAPGLRERTVCANAVGLDGEPVFEQVRLVMVGGRRVAVTGVIGAQAFGTIPPEQHAAVRAVDPAVALRHLHTRYRDEADSWVVLSHSGFAADRMVAAICPWVDVVFSGHCHTPARGPEQVGHGVVVKGAELGAGYAEARPGLDGWQAVTHLFPTGPEPLPPQLAEVGSRMGALRSRLAAPLGVPAPSYRNSVPDRRRVLAEVVALLHAETSASLVVLNETCLRPAALGSVLSLGDLLTIEPFANRLVLVETTGQHRDPEQLLADLSEHAGPLCVAPMPLPEEVTAVLTTDYLTAACRCGATRPAVLSLGQAVRRVLLADRATHPFEGEAR